MKRRTSSQGDGGLDIDANGTLDLASDDRIAEKATLFEQDGSSHWWAKTTSLGYNQSGSGTPITQGVSKSRLTGFSGAVQSESIATDLFGNQTSQVVEVDRTNRLVTQTTDVPDSTTDVVSISRNGLAQTAQSAQGLISHIYYDSLGRVTKQTDPRTDPSATPDRIAYATNSTRILSRQDTAGNTTSFGYDSTTGRVTSTTDPLGKVSYVSYTDRGQTYRTWGDTTYPVEYAYNDYGEQTTQSTFRGGTGWTASTWPTSPGTADTTTWAYDTASGVLTSKTDASSHAATYTYTSRGQLATRVWSRSVSGTPVTSTYAYSTTTGEQTGITYSDSTPSLSYTYNRLGQTATVGDVTGTRTFAYSSTNTTLTSETLPSYFDGRVLSRSYDTTTTGSLGRNIGFALSGASGSATEYSTGYDYDATGRFNALSVSTSALSSSYTYSFATNTNLIGTVAETSGWTETMSYESDRDLLASITGAYGSTTKAAFAYAHDALNRRVSVAESGEAFSRYVGSGLSTVYGYNDRSEVISAQSYHGTNPADRAQPVAGRGFGYAFDNIGSRTASSVVGATPSDIHATTYTNNTLNQVATRSAPAATDVSGLAPTAAAITINSSTSGVTRQGDYYYKNVAAGSTVPLWQSLAVSSSLGGSSTRYAYLAATTESFTYDLDGNVTDDGRWHYTWDAENRLTSMETSSAAQMAGVTRQYLTFNYDYLGRRVRKTVANWSGSAYVATVDRKFIYNGWNLISEHDALASDAALVRYLWGLDLSGNLTDGGGVGGLLAIVDIAGGIVHLPAYDANGNIHALVNKSTGNLTAAYEYSPFGETLRATGTYAATNNFRFSTKYTDAESGLLYYGFRYYSPTLGRWLGRDPMEEGGGLHLYAFCQNNAVNRWDYLGMDPPVYNTYTWFGQQVTWTKEQYRLNVLYQGNYGHGGLVSPGLGGSAGLASADSLMYSGDQTNVWVSAAPFEFNGLADQVGIATTQIFNTQTGTYASTDSSGANIDDPNSPQNSTGTYAPSNGGGNSPGAGSGNLRYQDDDKNWHEIPGSGSTPHSVTTGDPTSETTAAPNNTVTNLQQAQALAGQLGWNGFKTNLSESQQLYYGKTAADILALQAQGKDMTRQWQQVISEVPGVINDQNGLMASDSADLARRSWLSDNGALVVGGTAVGAIITGYTRHGLNQAISRDGVGVSPAAMLDAVKYPQQTIPQPGGATQFVGRDATVVMNANGKVITTWANNSGGVRVVPGNATNRPQGP